MDVLIRRRSVHVAAMDKLQAELGLNASAPAPSSAPVNVEELKIKAELVEQCRSSFLEFQEKIEDKAKSDEFDAHREERSKFEDKYIRVKAALRTSIIKHSPALTVVPVAAESSSASVQLPKISLPTFTGKYTEWSSFCDLFNAMVHHRSNLTSVQKLQYLKGSLSDEPLRLIQSLQVTEANYAEAWDRLK